MQSTHIKLEIQALDAARLSEAREQRNGLEIYLPLFVVQNRRTCEINALFVSRARQDSTLVAIHSMNRQSVVR